MSTNDFLDIPDWPSSCEDVMSSVVWIPSVTAQTWPPDHMLPLVVASDVTTRVTFRFLRDVSHDAPNKYTSKVFGLHRIS